MEGAFSKRVCTLPSGESVFFLSELICSGCKSERISP